MSTEELIQHLTDDTFDRAVSGGIVLVDFHADWCGPCRMLAPLLKEVAQKVQGKALIAKVDIEKAPQVAAKFEISSVPTMVLMKNGQEVHRLVGLRNALEIEQFVLSANS